MKTGRTLIMFMVLLPVFCMLAGGCTMQKDPYTLAVEAYGRGDYAAAEPYFTAAVESGDNRNEVLIGHAYNLLQLGQLPDAISVFLDAQTGIEKQEDLISVKKVMLSAYLTEQNYAGAARVSEELARLVPNQFEANDYLIMSSQIRADLYEMRGDSELLAEELNKLIELKPYAADEFVRLYELNAQDPDITKRLKTADSFIMYTTGHAAYMTDYTPVITILLDAADMTERTTYEHDREYYHTKAEEFMDKATELGVPEETLLKFKITIAERRGKMELAYKLLGVYLNHCPDDALAVKEREYLENRLGLD
ncbi:MAG: hypothetical protein J6Y89_10355 [Lachnospiraceae bacterium]|nr:hypothetical protein [Lachnospiraceae bacterium]